MEKNDKQIVDLYLATQSNLSAKTETNRSILKYLDGNLGEGERIALVPDDLTLRKIAEAGDDPDKVAACHANQALAENVGIDYSDENGVLRHMCMSAIGRDPQTRKVIVEGYSLRGEKVSCEASRVQNLDEVLMFLRYAHTEKD